MKKLFQIGTADKNIIIAESKVSVEKAKVLLSVWKIIIINK